MFVGVGASRVRDLFEQGKKNAPCIIFIDEIDAVGRHRGAGLGGGHDEREQTLNQLLVEMDGFESNEGVIIIAATNRPDVLDPALLRPGRFDRRIVVPRPDVRGRNGILAGPHAQGAARARDVDLEIIARGTPGFSGADLEYLVNEAALLAARQDKDEVEMRRLRGGQGQGPHGRRAPLDGHLRARRSAPPPSTRPATRWSRGSLRRRGRPGPQGHDHPARPRARRHPAAAAGGPPQHDARVRAEPDRDLLGGRVAEEIVFGQMTTGAGNDIEQATELARSMVSEWGMSEELGPLNFSSGKQEVFLGRDFAHERPTQRGHRAAHRRRDPPHRDRSSTSARPTILTEHRKELERIAEALLEHETHRRRRHRHAAPRRQASSARVAAVARSAKKPRRPRTRSAQAPAHPAAARQEGPRPSRRRRARVARGRCRRRLRIRRTRARRSSWAWSTSRPTRSPTAALRDTEAAIAHGRRLLRARAPTSSTSAARRPTRGDAGRRRRGAARASSRWSSALAAAGAARLDRHDQGGGRARGARGAARRSSTTSRAALFDPRMRDVVARPAPPTSCGHLRGALDRRGVRRARTRPIDVRRRGRAELADAVARAAPTRSRRAPGSIPGSGSARARRAQPRAASPAPATSARARLPVVVGPSRKWFLRRAAPERAIADATRRRRRVGRRRGRVRWRARRAGPRRRVPQRRACWCAAAERVQQRRRCARRAMPRAACFDGLTAARRCSTTIVDVALVYYLIYRLLLTIRGTRAAQMIVGIVLVGAAFFVAERLELTTVSWLLDNFISYFIILIIVVFQHDIRRALGRIGAERAAVRPPAGDDAHRSTRSSRRARSSRARAWARSSCSSATPRSRSSSTTRRAIDAALSRQLLVSLFVPATRQRAARRRGRDRQEPPHRARARAAAAVARDRPRPGVRHAPPRRARHHRGHRRGRGRRLRGARRDLAVLQGLDRARPRAGRCCAARSSACSPAARDRGDGRGGRGGGRGRQGDREHRRSRERRAADGEPA